MTKCDLALGTDCDTLLPCGKCCHTNTQMREMSGWGTMHSKKALDMLVGRKAPNMTICLPEHCGGLHPHKCRTSEDDTT